MEMKTIDLQYHIQTPRLYSRLIWQALMDMSYKEHGDLTRMDLFLCDLYTFERVSEQFIESRDTRPIYWTCVGSYTDIADYHIAGYDQIEIKFSKENNQIALKKVP